MNSTGWAVVVVLLIVVVGGAWWYMSSQAPATNNPAGTQEEGTPQVNDTPGETGSNVPAETGSGSTGGTGTNVNVGAGATVSTAPSSATVTYNGSSFSPANVTVARGGTVTFVNQGSSNMWVAADEHPSHTEYDGTDRATHCASGFSPKPFDQCMSGSSYSFTFTKAGTFEYHNHAAAQAGGTVVVQ